MQEEYQNIKEENYNNSVQPAPLGKNQKIAAAILIVFAIAVVGMWTVQFKKSITGPFASNKNMEMQNSASLRQEENSEEKLKSKDTDGDGLSDWDELYFYKTSPYLEDSDSDGFTDKQEVDSENDPNCPTGRDCYGADITETAGSKSGNSSKAEKIGTENGLINRLNIQNNEQGQEQELQNILSGQGDAVILRQMLIDAGMDKKILDQISDEDLIKSYQEILNK